MLNVIHGIDEFSKSGWAIYRFDFMLGFLTFLTWILALYQLRVIVMFGPLFKVMGKMIESLVKFIVIWVFMIFGFSCVTILLF